jgi:hypothetical protein
MFVRRLCAILRAPEGDGGSGGGGGSGGDDGNAPLFTEQQFTAIGEIVNKALTSKIPKMVSGGLEAGLKGVNWKDILTPLVADLVPKADSGSGGGSGDDAGKSKSWRSWPKTLRRSARLVSRPFRSPRPSSAPTSSGRLASVSMKASSHTPPRPCTTFGWTTCSTTSA